MHRPGRGASPAEVARAIGGAQAQEKRAGMLQLRARSAKLTAAGVERARVEERSIVRGWLMRGTVHLVAADDYRWLLSLWAETIAKESRRRLAALGLPAGQHDRALAVMDRALRSDAIVSRGELVERLASGGVVLTPQTRMHLMRLAVVEGIACLGPDERGSASLALAEDWLGEGGRRLDREASLAELARRYLGAFGPASERDFSFWSGLPLRDCRLGLKRIASELVDKGSLLALRKAVLRSPRSPLVRLLPAFDTYLMGYASRAHAVDEAGERRILPGGGVLRPTICVDGRFVGLWSSKRGGGGLAVTLEPFEPLAGAVVEAIEAEVADVGRFEAVTATLAGR